MFKIKYYLANHLISEREYEEYMEAIEEYTTKLTLILTSFSSTERKIALTGIDSLKHEWEIATYTSNKIDKDTMLEIMVNKNENEND